MNIYPTGTCFDDALDYLVENSEKYLVHGICRKDGEDYSHAWCESDDEAIGFGLVEFKGEMTTCVYYADKDEYYKRFDVQEKTTYDYDQALTLNHFYGHYGPWIQKYRRLCKDQKGGSASKKLPNISASRR